MSTRLSGAVRTVWAITLGFSPPFVGFRSQCPRGRNGPNSTGAPGLTDRRVGWPSGGGADARVGRGPGGASADFSPATGSTPSPASVPAPVARAPHRARDDGPPSVAVEAEPGVEPRAQALGVVEGGPGAEDLFPPFRARPSRAALYCASRAEPPRRRPERPPSRRRARAATRRQQPRGLSRRRCPVPRAPAGGTRGRVGHGTGVSKCSVILGSDATSKSTALQRGPFWRAIDPMHRRSWPGATLQPETTKTNVSRRADPIQSAGPPVYGTCPS